MQFLHPEFFYALPALLIPVLIHLFQLRRFKVQAFTNVALLEKIRLQTRKSSQLKKWLILIVRLLAIGCIILAFSQPFLSNQTAQKNSSETVIYLDNSFSMQALGPNGSLLSLDMKYHMRLMTQAKHYFYHMETFSKLFK